MKKMVLLGQKCISKPEEIKKVIHSEMRLQVGMGKFYFILESKDFSYNIHSTNMY